MTEFAVYMAWLSTGACIGFCLAALFRAGDDE